MLLAELIVNTASFLVASFGVFILLFYRKEQRFIAGLLGLVLAGLSLPCLTAILFYSGYITKVAWFYLLPSPITFLIAPAAFLYVRASLRNEWRFSKKDWWLCLPAIVHLAEMLPFYVMPIAQKEMLVSSLVKLPRNTGRFSYGILPPFLMPVIRMAWSFGFIWAQRRFISTTQTSTISESNAGNKELFSWLHLFTNVSLTLVLALLISSIVSPFFKAGLLISDLILGIGVCTIVIQLFLHPHVLYGLYKPSPEAVSHSIKSFDEDWEIEQLAISPALVEKDGYISPERAADFLRCRVAIDELMTTKLPFKDPAYSLNMLATALHQQRNFVSAVINREYGCGFREMINRQRVNYILANRHSPLWQHYNLEGIASEAGFKNRTTFIRNFKLVTGVNPSELLRKS